MLMTVYHKTRNILLTAMAIHVTAPDHMQKLLQRALGSAASVPLNISASCFAEITNSDTITDEVRLNSRGM